MPISVVRVYRNGSGVHHAKVSIEFTGFTNGGFATAYTDRNGVAQIQHASTGEVNVYVNGKKMPRRFRAPGEEVVYL